MKESTLKRLMPRSVFFRLMLSCATLVLMVTLLIGGLVNRLIVRGYHQEIEDVQRGAMEQ